MKKTTIITKWQWKTYLTVWQTICEDIKKFGLKKKCKICKWVFWESATWQIILEKQIQTVCKINMNDCRHWWLIWNRQPQRSKSDDKSFVCLLQVFKTDLTAKCKISANNISEEHKWKPSVKVPLNQENSGQLLSVIILSSGVSWWNVEKSFFMCKVKNPKTK